MPPSPVVPNRWHAARAKGGKYYADQSVREVYDLWKKVGNRMRATVAPAKAGQILDAMMKIDAVFETRENQDEAQRIINETTTQPATPCA